MSFKSGNEEDDDEAVQMLTTVCVGGVENRDVQQRRIMTEVVAVWCTSNAPYGPWIRAGQRRKRFRIEGFPFDCYSNRFFFFFEQFLMVLEMAMNE